MMTQTAFPSPDTTPKVGINNKHVSNKVIPKYKLSSTSNNNFKP
jgi:hypothetical protein